MPITDQKDITFSITQFGIADVAIKAVKCSLLIQSRIQLSTYLELYLFTSINITNNSRLNITDPQKMSLKLNKEHL